MAHDLPATVRTVLPWHATPRLRVRVETVESTLEGMADPCQDFDGRFVVVDDNGESFYVNGWQVELSFPEFPGFTFEQILAGLTVPATN